jgi:hypothetical protein
MVSTLWSRVTMHVGDGRLAPLKIRPKSLNGKTKKDNIIRGLNFSPAANGCAAMSAAA